MLHGRNRPFPRSRGLPGDAPTQSETTSWQAQVVTNGGAVSAARFTIVNNFIAAEKAAGTWALTDDYWGLWAEDTIGALTSLKQRRMGGTFSAPSFVPSRGYSFDGATNYMNTLFVPSTHAVVMTALSARLAVYERTNLAANAANSLGTNTVSTGQLSLNTRNASNVAIAAFNGINPPSAAVASSTGYTVFAATGNTTSNLYKNGILLLGPSAIAPSLSAFSTSALFIGASSQGGVLATPRATSIGFACIGAPLSATQEQAQYTNVQAWAAAIGAQV